MPSSQASLSRPAVRAAGVLFLLAPCWYLFCETIAALGFPGYDYARNYISDLGVPAGGVFEGRAMESRLAEVMNAGFIGEGLLITLAVVALLAADAGRRRRRGALFVLLLVHSAGIAVVNARGSWEMRLVNWRVAISMSFASLSGRAARGAMDRP